MEIAVFKYAKAITQI